MSDDDARFLRLFLCKARCNTHLDCRRRLPALISRVCDAKGWGHAFEAGDEDAVSDALL